MIFRLSYFLFISALITLVTSCSSGRKMVLECEHPKLPLPDGPAIVSKVYGVNSPIPINGVQFVNASLKRKIAVSSLTSERNPSGNIAINSRIVNCTSKYLHLKIRTSFLDKKMIKSEPATAWKSVLIKPKSFENYDEVSVNGISSSFVMEFDIEE